MTETEQKPVFDMLADPATHGGAEVTRHDTHGASVFLAGERAYKVKRAVRFPFLDYSTLEKRKAACLAELQVNQRFAPELYHRIVPITHEGGGLNLDGKGEPVEWAVEMTRFDDRQTLDHVAERGALRDALPSSLARMVAAMHGRAEPVDPAPWLSALPDYIAQNSEGFRKHGTIFPEASVQELEKRSRAALDRVRPLLAERGKLGLIRRCHGDLHLGNIALVDNEPVAFDAIEFDPVIASGDVLYDLAFLLMDLVERDLGGAANTVLNGYFEASRRIEDCDGLAALPLFLSLRAAIRAMVTAARLERTAEDKREAIAHAATKYFRLALDLLQPAVPRVLATGGLSGTGKSVLAKGLALYVAPVPGALVLRSDVERKTLFGKGEHDRLPPEAYRAEVSEQVYAVLNDKAQRIARAGHSVIADAVFAKSHERAAIEAAAREAGVAFQGFFLTADLDTRIRRVGGRKLDASDADAAVARQQEEFALGDVDWIIVDASGSPAETLARARKQMK